MRTTITTSEASASSDSTSVSVKQRLSSTIVDLKGHSSGTVVLSLTKPSDVSPIILLDTGGDNPFFMMIAINRAPTVTDFDMAFCPITNGGVQSSHPATIPLDGVSTELKWASFSISGDLSAFSGLTLAKMMIAIDQ